MHLYVCEVRPKTEYRHNNRLIFSDGLMNIKALKEIDQKRLKIHYIPDIAVSRLFSDEPTFKVLLGTNAVDSRGNITHTLGIRMIAVAAYINNIPTYVVAESAKYSDDILKVSDRNFRENWLTTDVEFEQILENCSNYNPREDLITFDRIDTFITEKGVGISKNFKSVF